MAMMLARVGQIAYINTWPVTWEMAAGFLREVVDITEGPPTELNRLLSEKTIDIAPVSSIAAAKEASHWWIFDDFCIASRGGVGSVILHSSLPVSQLSGKTIAVTSEAASSVRLLELLLVDHWEVEARLVGESHKAPARLIIGDEALRLANSSQGAFVYDLGAAWKEYSGHGFVFGLWCIRKDFALRHPKKTEALIHLLRLSYALGRVGRNTIIRKGAQRVGLPERSVAQYLNGLVYRLDEDLRTGLDLFLKRSGLNPDNLTGYNPG